jgi:hypothetical protein
VTRLALLGALTLAACGGNRESPEPSAAAQSQGKDDVALALAVAAGIDAHPAAADSVLAANGLTREGVDSLIYRIAADSALTAEYVAGRR